MGKRAKRGLAAENCMDALNSTGEINSEQLACCGREELLTGSKVSSDLLTTGTGHKNLDFTRLFFVANRRCKSFYKNKSTPFIPNNLQSCIMHGTIERRLNKVSLQPPSKANTFS